MSDILILTASFGMGHKSVSGAIKESIQTESPELEVDIADMWEIINPKLREFSTKMYNNLTEYYPVVYNTLYDIKKTSKNNIIDSILCTTYLSLIHI